MLFFNTSDWDPAHFGINFSKVRQAVADDLPPIAVPNNIKEAYAALFLSINSREDPRFYLEAHVLDARYRSSLSQSENDAIVQAHFEAFYALCDRLEGRTDIVRGGSYFGVEENLVVPLIYFLRHLYHQLVLIQHKEPARFVMVMAPLLKGMKACSSGKSEAVSLLKQLIPNQTSETTLEKLLKDILYREKEHFLMNVLLPAVNAIIPPEFQEEAHTLGAIRKHFEPIVAFSPALPTQEIGALSEEEVRVAEETLLIELSLATLAKAIQRIPREAIYEFLLDLFAKDGLPSQIADVEYTFFDWDGQSLEAIENTILDCTVHMNPFPEKPLSLSGAYTLLEVHGYVEYSISLQLEKLQMAYLTIFIHEKPVHFMLNIGKFSLNSPLEFDQLLRTLIEKDKVLFQAIDFLKPSDFYDALSHKVFVALPITSEHRLQILQNPHVLRNIACYLASTAQSLPDYFKEIGLKHRDYRIIQDELNLAIIEQRKQIGQTLKEIYHAVRRGETTSFSHRRQIHRLSSLKDFYQMISRPDVAYDSPTCFFNFLSVRTICDCLEQVQQSVSFGRLTFNTLLTLIHADEFIAILAWYNMTLPKINHLTQSEQKVIRAYALNKIEMAKQVQRGNLEHFYTSLLNGQAATFQDFHRVLCCRTPQECHAWMANQTVLPAHCPINMLGGFLNAKMPSLTHTLEFLKNFPLTKQDKSTILANYLAEKPDRTAYLYINPAELGKIYEKLLTLNRPLAYAMYFRLEAHQHYFVEPNLFQTVTIINDLHKRLGQADCPTLSALNTKFSSRQDLFLFLAESLEINHEMDYQRLFHSRGFLVEILYMHAKLFEKDPCLMFLYWIETHHISPMILLRLTTAERDNPHFILFLAKATFAAEDKGRYFRLIDKFPEKERIKPQVLMQVQQLHREIKKSLYQSYLRERKTKETLIKWFHGLDEDLIIQGIVVTDPFKYLDFLTLQDIENLWGIALSIHVKHLPLSEEKQLLLRVALCNRVPFLYRHYLSCEKNKLIELIAEDPEKPDWRELFSIDPMDFRYATVEHEAKEYIAKMKEKLLERIPELMNRMC